MGAPDALRAESLYLASRDGHSIDAYLARPLDRGSVGSVIVLHHMPGLDESTKEIVRRLAAEGFNALCPNLYAVDAPGRPPEGAFAAIWAQGGLNDDLMIDIVGVAIDFIRTLSTASDRIGLIGFCSGGRQALLAGCRLPVDAVVDCYGSFVIEKPSPDIGLSIPPISAELSRLSCPVLGLFGLNDDNPGPAEVGRLGALLKEHGKDATIRSLPDAGHAFLAVDRDSYRPTAAAAGWAHILEFLDQHLS